MRSRAVRALEGLETLETLAAFLLPLFVWQLARPAALAIASGDLGSRIFPPERRRMENPDPGKELHKAHIEN